MHYHLFFWFSINIILYLKKNSQASDIQVFFHSLAFVIITFFFAACSVLGRLMFRCAAALVAYACFPEDNIYSRLFVRPSVGERGGLAGGGPLVGGHPTDGTAGGWASQWRSEHGAVKLCSRQFSLPALGPTDLLCHRY